MVDCHGMLLNTSQWDLKRHRWTLQEVTVNSEQEGVGGMGGGSCSGADDDDDLYIIFARNILLQISDSLQIC